MRVASTATYRTWLPRKRSFAKLKPARVEKNTTDALTAAATSSEFANASQKSNCSVVKTCQKFSNRCSVGSQRGSVPTVRAISVVVEDPYIAAAYSGKIDSTTTTDRSA